MTSRGNLRAQNSNWSCAPTFCALSVKNWLKSSAARLVNGQHADAMRGGEVGIDAAQDDEVPRRRGAATR
jgi:hypothetical protein